MSKKLSLLAPRLCAAFALLAAVCIGFPHAWVSNAVILSMIFATLTLAFRSEDATDERLISGASPIRPLVVAVVGFTAIVGLRMITTLTSGQATGHTWSGLGHYLVPGVIVALAIVIAPRVRPAAQDAMVLGISLITILYVGVSLLPLPSWRLFSPYQIYVGNDAIALAIGLAVGASATTLLALQAGWLNHRQRATRWAVLALALTAALIVFGQSRSALLIFCITIAFGSMLVGRIWWQRCIAPVAMAVIMVVVLGASAGTRERITTAGKEVINALALYKVETSQGQRLALASVSVRIWQDAFWFGHGLGSWRDEFVKRVPPQWQKAIGAHSSPHNEYLHILGQLGLAGLMAYLAVICALLYVGAVVLLASGPPWLFVLAMALGIGSITNVFVWDFRFFAPFSALLICAIGQLSPHAQISEKTMHRQANS